MLKIGEQIPQFSTTNHEGKVLNNNDLIGQKSIVFFYPKDMTPGCTAEACSLRDSYDEIKDKGYKIYGVSADGETKHQKFIEKYDLPFELLADTEKEIIQGFGVWGRKKFMGKEYDGILRTTFGVDEKGLVLFIIDKVKTKTHGQQILEAIEK